MGGVAGGGKEGRIGLPEAGRLSEAKGGGQARPPPPTWAVGGVWAGHTVHFLTVQQGRGRQHRAVLAPVPLPSARHPSRLPFSLPHPGGAPWSLSHSLCLAGFDET